MTRRIFGLLRIFSSRPPCEEGRTNRKRQCTIDDRALEHTRDGFRPEIDRTGIVFHLGSQRAAPDLAGPRRTPFGVLEHPRIWRGKLTETKIWRGQEVVREWAILMTFGAHATPKNIA